ncbi:MAG TPA: ABC transporter ATP-binding protein [Clostridia bacterium]|jgi:ATP-binding cassette subfamily B protein|nr:ABC transporter ATP-binding protein [Clostridia bacterium]HQA97108.1 ABC transporter ATP-binding protein [Clostridia bacterium]HUM60102.1 ABC transporter ATP-binding protein [Clostridia bacterium]
MADQKQRQSHAPRGHGGGPRGRIVEKPQNFKASFRRLLQALRPWRGRLLVCAALSVLSAVMGIFGPRITGQATTAIFEGLVARVRGTGGIDFARVGRVLLFLLGLYLASSLVSFAMNRLVAGITAEYSRSLRGQIGRKIHRISVGYYEKTSVGDILSRVTNDVDSISQNISNIFTQTISGIATLIGVLVMMLSISPLMTGLVVLVVPLSMGMMGLIFSRSQKFFKRQQEGLGEVSGLVEETFSGHLVVQAFRQEEAALERFNRTNDRLYDSAWKSQFFTGLMHPLMSFVGNLSYLLVVVFGAAQAAMGRITVGDIQAFIQYARNFMQPLTQFSQVSGQIQTMTAAAERVFAFLDVEEEQEPEGASALPPVRGRVCFENVRFGYDPDKVVIHDFSMCVLPGQTCAIVGETGSGKTTLVKLLMRFYDPQSGRITLDGVDLKSLSRQQARSAFGMVLQDTWLFSGSIMENIRYGRPDATDEQVMQAARHAHADHFILTQPGGYGMQINEEADNISSGQKQLLTIARAMLADKPVLILDEATSNVDTLTEHRIQRAMSTLMAGRTSFVIAHRLSTIREADVILVMHEGGIAEHGNHEQLMALGGRYKELYESQFEQV